MSRFAKVVPSLAAFVAALFLLVPGAQAMRVKVDGHVYGVMPTADANFSAAAARGSVRASRSPLLLAPDITAPAGWNVQYEGGPVLHTTAPYVIYWNPSNLTPSSNDISATSQGIITKYLSDVATDSGETDDTYGVGRQYYDSVGYADAGMTFSGSQALIDTDPYPSQDTANCPTESGYTSCVTDTQLQQELTNFMSAHNLPTDGPDTESEFPANAPVYFMVLPAKINTCMDSADCSGGPLTTGSVFTYCAYHSELSTANGNAVLYADVPFSPFTASAKGCQDDDTSTSVLQAPNGDNADNVVDNLSHELNETITDPVGTAWVNPYVYGDPTQDGNELADQCEAYAATSDPTTGHSSRAYVPLGGSASAGGNGFGSLFDQLINGDRYYTQSLWSNGQVDCEMQPTAATLTSNFTATGALAGKPMTFDPTSTNTSAGAASVTWNWGDGSSSFVPGALATATHSFASDGTYTVKLTVVDTNGNVASISKQVSVAGGNPTPAIGSLPASVIIGTPVSFSSSGSSDPNQGATPSYFWNFGDGGNATGATTSHTYTAAGNYTVTLSESDSWGASATKTATIAVVYGAVTKVGQSHTKSAAYALVTVSQAGSLTYGGHTTKVGVGTAKLKLKLTAQQRAKLKHRRSFSLTVRLVYTPAGGPTAVRTARLKL